ncbi:histidine phosphatase family protein [soil metagenome]
MSILNVWLIRHGESTINAGLWTNLPHAAHLTTKGQEQAKKVAAEITARPDLIVVSPAQRSKDSAAPIIEHWSDVPIKICPIQEFTYLSPAKFQNDLPLPERTIMVEDYWSRCDPFFCDGDGAESFADFIKRLEAFHQCLLNQKGFLVVVGHGQFFRAYQLGLLQGFAATPIWMQQFRTKERSQPMVNSEVLKLEFH